VLRGIYVLFVGCVLAALAHAAVSWLLPHAATGATLPSDADQALADLAAAIVYMAIGLSLHSRFEELADGFVAGGMFAAVTAVVISFGTDTSGFSFAVLAIALVAAILLGYFRFFRHRA